MKMYSKNIVRCISMLEDIYVIVIAVISLIGTVDRVSTTVTYLLLLLSLCGVVFLVVASIKNNKFEGYVRSTCFLVIMANLYLWIKPW